MAGTDSTVEATKQTFVQKFRAWGGEQHPIDFDILPTFCELNPISTLSSPEHATDVQ